MARMWHRDAIWQIRQTVTQREQMLLEKERQEACWALGPINLQFVSHTVSVKLRKVTGR